MTTQMNNFEEERLLGNGDSQFAVCGTNQAPEQHVNLEDNHVPMPIKKITDLNGMAIPKHGDLDQCKNLTAHSEISEEAKTEQQKSTESTEQNQVELVKEQCLPEAVESGMSSEDIEYVCYESEHQMAAIMALITKDLSEPYSIYTYRYFIHNWPNLCFLAMYKQQCVGAIVCKLDIHKSMVHRGYIAMLAVEKDFRRHKIGTILVKQAIRAMIEDNCDEVVLETEITNKAALRLYENLGFVRDKRLFRYYLNGVDALRLKLWLR